MNGNAESQDFPDGAQQQSGEAWIRPLVGPCMFYLSLLFLGLLASVMVLWIDVPRAIELHLEEVDGAANSLNEMLSDELSEDEIRYEASAFGWGLVSGTLLLLIWPLFIAEQIFIFVESRRETGLVSPNRYWWLFCICPPLRLCAHHRFANTLGSAQELGPEQETEKFGSAEVWLPSLGWQRVDRKLRKALERQFSIPMILIALLILPVLGLQFYFQARIAEYPGLRFILHFGTGLIWFAFAVEFIVMVSVAEKKLAYCKRNWLDLAIILLPLISFLRTLRILRAGKLLKVVRVYRLRGVAMRALRALMLLEVMHRLLGYTPQKRIAQLEQLYFEKQRELEELAEEIEQLRKRHASESK